MSASTVSKVLAAAKDDGRAALIGYLPVGFPSVEGSLRAMEVLVENGVDIVEIGLPYTDPLMDGPVIQTAATRALEGGVRVADVFRAGRAVSATGAGALVMTYWNPVLRYGADRFAAELAGAGVSGLITPDLVPDEAQDWLEASEAHDLDRVFLVAPSSTPERLQSTTAASRGFVYATALMGVTGARTSVGSAASVLVGRVREVTDLPVCVGLGVSTREQVAEVARFADGVIVGSALVRCLVDAPDPDTGLKDLGALAADLAQGVRR
ncbi:tryptophan synthase subunit alpha [Luteipulveratus sp. YIM 133132]|uniref:Tryptophan synthase alpha chain n=1 Tax=Luteipulveratus flavus TaxID=3031728 RepID=A0ABT6C7R4_9MICO|nr:MULTISPECIES: tryptophan synthase subunit alpha [unclassified Luteipulveratus]MDE9366012.1 tryptophan synthase subunit alpha [Luteipulveratus sp. YIM 133132]MDF8264114.1 tryptophan synthase subunit alpha [Luteipulveratus sp. YIM 133296]